MNKEIHVCILTTSHPVDDKRVNHKFAHAFRAAGFRVSWVGPSNATFDSENYNQENIQFILSKPIRTKFDRLFARHSISLVARQLSKVDVYYAPDPDSAQLAISLARNNNAKVIFDIHEIYHGALLERWLLGHRVHIISEYIRRSISRIASQCDLVIGVSNAVLKQYLNKRIPQMVIRSCAPSCFANVAPSDVCSPQRNSFNIMHGISDLGRMTMQVVEAAAIAHSQACGLRVIMFEAFRNKDDTATRVLLSRIKELGLTGVIDLRPGIPFHDMPRMLQTCDVGMIAYGPGLGVDSLPNRLFEYMSIGLPIIAPIYSREIASIINSEKCGILVDFEDPKNIAKAIVQLKRNQQFCREMGRRAREAFQMRHNWETEVQPLIKHIKRWQEDSLS